jgi:hypothetical protein
MTGPTNVGDQPNDPPDWMDGLLARAAEDHAGDYIADNGFTARVMQHLPLASALPAWRRPAVMLLWAIAGILLAASLPGVELDLARAAYTLFSARPFSLSTLGIVLAAIGVATWTAAAVALRRD